MKNFLFALVAFMVPGLALAQTGNPYVFQKNLSADEVVGRMEKSEFLPLLLNDKNSFFNPEEKARVVKAAVAQVKKHNNYQAHYNAAVVYATYAEFNGLDAWDALDIHDAENAIRHATIAIGKSPKTPYMYLLRGQVYYDQSVWYNPREMEFSIKSHDYAKKALADFKEVLALQPSLAPYRDMAILSRLLGRLDEAGRYEGLAKQQEEKASKKQAEKAAQAVKKKILSGLKHVVKRPS